MRNRRKIEVLTALEGRGWLNARLIGGLVNWTPRRGLHTYLNRLRRWGLIRRRVPRGGLILYALSARGQRRLTWLKAKAERRGDEQ